MAVTSYPKLDDLFARRAVGRTARARLTFSEKLDILEELRAAAAPFKAIRAKGDRRTVKRTGHRLNN